MGERRHRCLMDAGEWTNEVRLVGRMSADAEERELPSGDRVAQLRVVIPRDTRTGAGRVDTIDVACWSARTRRSARGLKAQDTVEVSGALRRRFFRTGTVTVSRYEVEALSLKRIRPASSRSTSARSR
jgi:single-strand DNA-binding protein